MQAVDEMIENGLIDEPVTAQIGEGRFEPRLMTFDRFIDKSDYDSRIREASRLIGHAGSGTIALALEHQKPLLVLPRLKRFGEHVNDHQLPTARKFEELHHVLAAYDTRELPEKFAALRNFVPRARVVHATELAARVGDFLRSIE